MDETNQIEVPASFCALFTSPAGRLTEPYAVVQARYELCEDLAQMLVEQAATLEFKTGLAPAQVLQSMQAGLTGEDAVVTQNEASWVVQRMAELLGWSA